MLYTLPFPTILSSTFCTVSSNAKKVMHWDLTLDILLIFTYNFPFFFYCNAGAPGHPGPKGERGESISRSVPTVTVSPSSLTVTQHQTATFYCSVYGNPKPSISWSKISGAGLGTGNRLHFSSADYSDSGSYICKATSVLGEVHKQVELLVKGKICG